MSYFKFENSDLFYNTIKAKPRFEFKIWSGKAVVNGGTQTTLNALQTVPPVIVPPTPSICANPNSLDFSCQENSYNIAVI